MSDLRYIRLLNLGWGSTTPPVSLGVVGENEATLLRFDCTSVISAWPDASYCVTIQRVAEPAEEAYVALVGAQPDGKGRVLYPLSHFDAGVSGTIKVEISALRPDGSVAKNAVFTFIIDDSISNIPSTQVDPQWLTELTEGVLAAQAANNSALATKAAVDIVRDSTLAAKASVDIVKAAIDDSYAVAVQNGYSGTEIEWIASLEHVNGIDGTSIASIEKTGTLGLVDTYTVTLTDASTTTFEVINGTQGVPGTTGPVGATGPTGHGLNILGVKASLAVLQSEVPSPAAGAVYAVGASAPYTLYVYAGTWVSLGTLTASSASQLPTANPAVSVQSLLDGIPLSRNTVALSVAQITPVPSSPLDATIKTVAVQAGSGDPSPSNIRAITGKASAKVKRMGKNLLNLAITTETKNGVTVTHDSVAQTITFNGTCTSNNTSFALLNTPFIIPAAHVISLYYVSGSITATGINTFQIAAAGWNPGVSMNLTTSSVGVTKVNTARTYAATGQGFRTDAGTVLTNYVIKVQIELGSDATTYEPYSGTELTLTPATTLYGLAGAEDEIGVDGLETHKTKVLTLTSSVTNVTDLGTVARCGIGLSQAGSLATLGLCSHFVVTTSYTNDTEHCNFGTGAVYLFIAKSRLATVDAAGANAWLAAQSSAGTPVQVLYQLATPTTAQGTAQTLAALAQADKYTPRLNNVYSDGGNVVVGYAKSPIQEAIDAPLPAGTGNSWYAGRDLKALYGDAATFMAALRKGVPFDIRIGDYWPITLNGTYRDFGSYKAPSGITYYSDAGLTTSVGTTTAVYEATYGNATYCAIWVSSVVRYVKTSDCIPYYDKTLSNAVVLLEVAGINIYQGYGDPALTAPHILFCPRDCLPFTTRMRKADAVWYSEATTNPWLGSAMYATLNDALYGLLPLIAATDIGAYIYAGPNGNGMRAQLPDMASGLSTPTGSSPRDRGKLFLPSEREVRGSSIVQSSVTFGALALQWPIFTGSYRHIVKGLGNGGSRAHCWEETAVGVTAFTLAHIMGAPSSSGASLSAGITPCFLVA